LSKKKAKLCKYLYVVLDVAKLQWLMPVIPAEVKIRRITVGSNPGQIVQETLSQKPITKKGWWSG
jgi:hypothetical protein